MEDLAPRHCYRDRNRRTLTLTQGQKGDSTTLYGFLGDMRQNLHKSGVLREHWGLKILLRKSGTPNKVNLFQRLCILILLFKNMKYFPYLFHKRSKMEPDQEYLEGIFNKNNFQNSAKCKKTGQMQCGFCS